MKRILLSVILLALAAVYSQAEAVDWRNYYLWMAYIDQDDGMQRVQLRIGASERAYDGYDAMYDIDAYFSGQIRSYFYHPEWGRSSIPGGTDYYVGDIRSTYLPQTWDFDVMAYNTGRNVTLTWNLSRLRNIGACSAVELALTDMLNGQTVVLTEAYEDDYGNKSYINTSYVYYNSSSAPHGFRIVATEVPVPSGDAPDGLRGSTGGGRIVLVWNSAPEALGYRVYRSENGSGLALISGEALVTDVDGDGEAKFTDKTASKGKTGPMSYTYEVTAVGSDGCESRPVVIDVAR
jgi:hypothetical protein